MAISLLDAVKQALGESGIDVPTAVVAADDKTALYVANRAARELRRYQLQKLVKLGSITLTSATSYNLPSDFWAYVPDTLVQQDGGTLINMPTTPSDWLMLKANVATNSAVFNCRFINDKLEVQNPEADEVLKFEYISKYPITDSTGATSKGYFTADTDLCILDDDLFVLMFKAMWQLTKGLMDNDKAFAFFERERKYRCGVDAGAQTIRPNDVSTGRIGPWWNPFQ